MSYQRVVGHSLWVLVVAGVVLVRGSPDEATPEVVPTTEQQQEGSPVTYEGSQLVWICHQGEGRPQIPQELLNQTDFEMWGLNETCWQYMIPGQQAEEIKQKLTKAGLTYEVSIDDLQRAIDTENPPPSDEDTFDGRKATRRLGYYSRTKVNKKRPNKTPTKAKRHKMTWNSYHRLNDIYGYLDFMAQSHPDLVTVGSVGNSVEGRPLKYVKISSGKPNAKSFWIDGGIHAREWITPAAVTYIINELVENRDAHLREVDGIDYYIMPVMNPDGYEYTHSRDRLWRKNRAKGYYCQGTDLNRNWGFRWGGKGASQQQCQEIYGGTKAFSEPETASSSRFISSIPNTKGFVTFHSYGQYILYPYGYDQNQLPQDHADLERVGRKAASAIKQVGGSHYTVGNSANTLYPASGGADDWAKGGAGIKYSYTIELRDTGRFGFVLPAQYIIPTAKEALAAVKVISAEIQALP